jgi:hypothetical protein
MSGANWLQLIALVAAVVLTAPLKQSNRVLAPVASEVAVVAVDHRQTGSHVAREVEGGDAGTEEEGRERVPKIVDPAKRRDPGRLLCRPPFAGPEV